MAYSDTVTCKLHLRQIGIGSQRMASLPDADLARYQAIADTYINGRLHAVYITPLIQITRTTTFYPHPIPDIAARLTASFLITDVFSEVEPNVSQASVKNQELAEGELNKILSKQYHLEGQRRKPRNFGSNPMTEPLTEPTTPPKTTP